MYLDGSCILISGTLVALVTTYKKCKRWKDKNKENIIKICLNRSHWRFWFKYQGLRRSVKSIKKKGYGSNLAMSAHQRNWSFANSSLLDSCLISVGSQNSRCTFENLQSLTYLLIWKMKEMSKSKQFIIDPYVRNIFCTIFWCKNQQLEIRQASGNWSMVFLLLLWLHKKQLGWGQLHEGDKKLEGPSMLQWI